MKISVIIPVYNEAKTIARIIHRVKESNPTLDMEILVVDDCSTDGTSGAVGALGDSSIVLMRHARNQGKGAAIRTALARVSGDVVIIQDADLEYDPKDYSKLLAPIIAKETSVVYGSRILKKDNPRAGFTFYIGGRLLSFLANALYGLRITDEPTCYKVFKSDILRSLDLKCTGFEFCPEVTAKLARKGYSIVEVPISYRPRSVAEGKKIRWRDGVTAVWTLLKYRFCS